MIKPKYLFTNEQIVFNGTVLHRIRAIREISSNFDEPIPPGALGGWVENEENLSHSGLCWVHQEAKVFGKAHVSGDARITDQALVCGHALVSGEALWPVPPRYQVTPTFRALPKSMANKLDRWPCQSG
jgi:hypothetical protein